MTNYFFWTGEPKRALESGHRCLAIATDLGDFTLQVRTNQALGQAYYALGDYHRSIDFLRSTVVSLHDDLLYERFGLTTFPSVASRSFLVWCLTELGEFSEAIAIAEEGVRIAEAVKQPASLIVASSGIGLLYLRKGHLKQAIPVLERCLGLDRVSTLPVFLIVSTQLGYAYALSGNIVEALPLLEQAVQQASSISVMVGHSLRVAWLSEAYLLAGRMDDARELAGRALGLAHHHNEQGSEAYVLRLLGEIASHRDPHDVETAQGHYRQAMALATELDMRPLIAHCHLGLGVLYRRTGKRQEAQEHLATATTMMRDMEMGFWLQKAEAELKECG